MDIKSIQNAFNEKIDSRINKLTEEINKYQQLIKENEFYYGGGGPIKRWEKAINWRVVERTELEEFKKGLNSYKPTTVIKLNYMNCPQCGAVICTTDYVKRGYHECPCCGKTVYSDSGYKTEIEVVEGKAWVRELKKKSLEAMERERNGADNN